ncbi:Baculoviral IAP repeat-containing protein 7-A [Armadillidium vulgare]|nr:Baculoviral IAP repeat-containing protein 7-A [Armadillidium vulgare]
MSLCVLFIINFKICFGENEAPLVQPNSAERKLPVLVFIHGGGFVFGAAHQYPPHALMNKDIVFVAIQYRLGIFGFLSTEDSVIPGNMGLKDQQLALKWIKENIGAFGGDPDRITIFGESAGGASVNYQILSPGSKGLFARAIMQSGTSICPWASNKDHRKFAIETGHQFNCSIETGSEKYWNVCKMSIHIIWNLLNLNQLYVLPRVDGEFIDEAPEILMKKGKYNKVDIISGITKDEGGFFLLLEHLEPSVKQIKNDKFDEAGPAFLSFRDEEHSVELSKQVYRYYLQREDITLTDEDKLKKVEVLTDRHFKVCHDIVSQFFSADDKVRFYSYQLDHFGQSSFLAIPGYDRSNLISHAEDLPYLFSGGVFGAKNMEDEDDLKLREIILNLWVNFAEYG